MNTVVWIVAGASLAWLAFEYFQLRMYSGLVATMAVGALGAYFGGSFIAPLLGQTASGFGGFQPFALVVAAASAGACLIVSKLVHERFGV